MMKKEMIFVFLIFGYMGNGALAEENVQTKTNEQNDVTEQGKTVEQPRVLDRGLDTEFKGYTLDDVVNGKTDLNILLFKYDKKHNFEDIGFLKDLSKYPKAKEHINRNNAFVCFDRMQLPDR